MHACCPETFLEGLVASPTSDWARIAVDEDEAPRDVGKRAAIGPKNEGSVRVLVGRREQTLQAAGIRGIAIEGRTTRIELGPPALRLLVNDLSLRARSR